MEVTMEAAATAEEIAAWVAAPNKAPAKPKLVAMLAAAAPQVNTCYKARVKKIATIALGCAIPAASFALSHIGGELLASAETAWMYTLAAMFGACCIAVLIVSLPHLAKSIQDITGEPTDRNGWCLAVTLDAGLIISELCLIYGSTELAPWCWAVIGVTSVFSAFLNCWAFLVLAHKPVAK